MRKALQLLTPLWIRDLMFVHDLISLYKRFVSRVDHAKQPVTFELVNGGMTFPSKAYDDDVGYDLYASADTTLAPFTVTAVKTGVRIAVHDKDIFPKIESRSGLALKTVFVVGGIIEPKYKGEIKVLLYNGSPHEAKITLGQRVAQVVFYKYTNPVHVNVMFERDRQDAGFGSSD